MRDVVYFAHIIMGFALVVLPVFILFDLNKKSVLYKPLSFVTAGISWLILFPAGKLYTTFYPATKTLILAGPWPWAHSIVMETKEHWGLLLPIVATVAAGLVFSGEAEESKRWWTLLAILALLIGAMGRIVKMGAFA